MLLAYEINTCKLPDRRTAVVRGEMPADELPGWLAGVYPTVTDYLHRVHVRRIGPPFARYARLGDLVAVEAGFPVSDDIDGDDLVEPSTLPDALAATTLHRGRYEELPRAHRAVLDWLAEHGHTPAGPSWDVFCTNPDDLADPEQWCTTVVVPYERSADFVDLDLGVLD